MNIIETRKYFDYELAYEGYKKAKELLEKGGIQAVIDDDEFDISDGTTINTWVDDGFIPVYNWGCNVGICINDENFGTDNKEHKWYVDNEVEICSYGGGDDIIRIDNEKDINDRINGLLDYAKENEYTIEDYEKELKSLEKVKEELLCN